MTRASTSLSVERETAQYIKNRLAQEGIKVTTKVRKKAVEITTVDAHPEVQRRVYVVAKEHQTARSYIQADYWDHGNIRKDLPQTTWVQPRHQMSEPFGRRLQALDESLEGPNSTGLRYQDLFQGTRPEFWATELGGPQPYRCTYCRGPIGNVNAAEQYDGMNGTLYRHADC